MRNYFQCDKCGLKHDAMYCPSEYSVSAKKPKYQIGQEVWRIKDGKCVKETIQAVALAQGDVVYSFTETKYSDSYGYTITIPESLLFLSKEELIESLK